MASHLAVDLGSNLDVRGAHVRVRCHGDAPLEHLLYACHQVDVGTGLRHGEHSLVGARQSSQRVNNGDVQTFLHVVAQRCKCTIDGTYMFTFVLILYIYHI